MKSTAILVSKNDDYGKNLHARVVMSLTSLINNHDEVILVDWKTKNKNSIISNIKNKIPHSKKLKCIEVSDIFLQKKFPQISNYNIIESIGRNIGIRRAENEIIVSTNVDIITEPIDFKNLNKQSFYTVARRDVEENIHLGFNDYKSLYSFLLENKDKFPPKNKIFDENDKWSLVVCCGDYQVGYKNIWENIRGFEESIFFGCGIDSNVMKKASFYSKLEILNAYVFHLNHGKGGYLENNEIIPQISDQEKIIKNFQKTENSENWGMYDEEFEIEII